MSSALSPVRRAPSNTSASWLRWLRYRPRPHPRGQAAKCKAIPDCESVIGGPRIHGEIGCSYLHSWSDLARHTLQTLRALALTAPLAPNQQATTRGIRARVGSVAIGRARDVGIVTSQGVEGTRVYSSQFTDRGCNCWRYGHFQNRSPNAYARCDRYTERFCIASLVVRK